MFFFGHKWGDLPMIFMSDEVTSDIIRKSHHKWPKIIIHSNSCIILYIRDVLAFCYEINQMKYMEMEAKTSKYYPLRCNFDLSPKPLLPWFKNHAPMGKICHWLIL